MSHKVSSASKWTQSAWVSEITLSRTKSSCVKPFWISTTDSLVQTCFPAGGTPLSMPGLQTTPSAPELTDIDTDYLCAGRPGSSGVAAGGVNHCPAPAGQGPGICPGFRSTGPGMHAALAPVHGSRTSAELMRTGSQRPSALPITQSLQTLCLQTFSMLHS